MKQKVILTERITGNEIDPEPLTRKIYLELNEPSLEDNQADVDRLRQALTKYFEAVTIPLELMRIIPIACREGNWRVTATVGTFESGWRLIDLQPGNTLNRHFGLVIDVGTTTVVTCLVDMNSGEIIAQAADYNGQVNIGEDILTRIYFASTKNGLLTMQRTIAETINKLIKNIKKKNKIEEQEICAVTVGANTTMVHLLLGLDPSRICMSPYIPVVNNPGFLTALSIGLDVNPQAIVYCLPGVGSYVGGDVTGGILASGMHCKEELALFVDIGTNGEIILGNKDWIVACAGAAGPALEGGVVKDGMRAEEGAIDSVKIDPDTLEVHYATIGDVPPEGICGSGLVDCLAELLLAGLIDRAGRFKDGRESFLVVPKEKTTCDKDIVITQTDINNLLRTKGAVSAALELLLESVGCELSQIEHFYASGAFGKYLNLESAVTIGLYPDLPREKMTCLGNSSIEGARLVLLSRKKRQEVEKIVRNITYFELNVNQVFMNKFIGSKFLPHTNLDYFPTVKAKLAARGHII